MIVVNIKLNELGEIIFNSLDVFSDDILWSFSLLTIAVASVILAGSRIIGADLPDLVVRLLGIIDLIALPVLIYSSIQKKRN